MVDAVHNLYEVDRVIAKRNIKISDMSYVDCQIGFLSVTCSAILCLRLNVLTLIQTLDYVQELD